MNDERRNALIEVNIEDMLESLGLKNLRRGRRLLRWLCRPAATRFADKVLAVDHAAGEGGLQAAGWWGLSAFTTRLTIHGQENIPSSGPLLVFANHPGMADTLALFASIPRPDLRVVAARRPFLELLSNIDRRLIYVEEQSKSALAPIRAITTHLRQGGAILTFPAGKIEPDPAIGPGAVESLSSWTTSIDLLARLSPECVLVPALVSGVLSPRAKFHPLTKVRRTQRGREHLGAMLQLLATRYGHVHAHVNFGAGLVAGEVLRNGGSSPATQAVVAAMNALLSARLGA